MAVRRPGGLWAVALIAVTLGAVGGCMGLWGVVGTAMQDTLSSHQQELFQGDGMEPAQVEAQRVMQEGMVEATRPYRPVLIAQQAANVLVSICLLVAGILLLRWDRRALPLFGIAAIANVLVDSAGAVVQVIVQQVSFDAMQDSMGPLLANPQQPAAEEIMHVIMGAMGKVTICVAVLWTLFKVGYYVASLVYLRREPVRRLFGG